MSRVKVASLLFSSGLCALVYQMAWLRSLRLVFGASTAATAAVLAIFMAGLGLGSALLGRRADTHSRPLLLYANLEMGVALLALLSPALIALVRMTYFAVGGTLTLGFEGGTIVRLLLSTLVLGLPTLLMGGTLPAAIRSIETDSDENRSSAGLVYGANTLGAVTGALLATFYLLEFLGVHGTIFAAAGVNGIVAIVARRLALNGSEVTPDPPKAEGSSTGWTAHSRFVVGAAAVAGFVFLLMELVWYRMLAPILGGSSYTFGLILAVALLGIGIGSMLYSRRDATKPLTMASFAGTCVLEGLLLALPLALGDNIAYLAMTLRGLGTFGFGGLVMGWTIVVAIVVLPGAIISGYQFPLLLGLMGSGKRDVGREVGVVYAWNTVGAILGSLGGGFGVLPWLTAPATWRAVVIMLLVLGVISLATVWRSVTTQFSSAILVAIIASIMMVMAPGPSAAWRHSPIGAGIASSKFESPNAYRNWLNDQRRSVFWEREGVESSVALNRRNGYAFVINGKVDGNARGDAPTQVMGGILSGALHPNPKHGLVIGLGTGATAGWLASFPTMERVDAVELEPAILDVVKVCAPVNQSCLENPKINPIIADAREVLTTTKERYDVVFSEPSNPYRAGIASLFTQDFYQAVHDRLNDDGLFLQWVQAYHVDASTIRTVFSTLQSVFDSIEVWETTLGSDLILVASKSPLKHDLKRLEKVVSSAPVSDALRLVWGVHGVYGFMTGFVANRDLVEHIAKAENGLVCTDDNSLVEYGFARSLGRTDLFETDKIHKLARRLKMDLPNTTGSALDNVRMLDMRSARAVMESRTWSSPFPVSGEVKFRAQSRRNFSKGMLPAALSNWQSQSGQPLTIVDHMILGETLAMKGSKDADAHIAEVAKHQPTQALAMSAQKLAASGDIPGAAAALVKAFVAYRDDPWPLRPTMDRALYLAQQIAEREPTLAPDLDEAISKTFSVGCLEDRRMHIRAKIAFLSQFKKLCVAAIEPLEPHVPWNRDFLERRLLCYKAHNHERLEQAEADMLEYLTNAPPPLEVN